MRPVSKWLSLPVQPKKKEKATNYNNMDGPGRHAKWNKLVIERQIMHDSTYMTIWNSQIDRRRK